VTTPLRIAVVGAGAIGRAHIDRILKSRDCRLVTIVDPAPGALEVAAKAGVPLLASLPDLLAKQTLDGVIIATPNRLHVEQGLACIAAGVPALIEKPLSDTIDSGERLCQAAESARVKLLTGHHRQHNAIMSRAVEVVKSGRLGRLVAVVGTEMFCKPDQYFEDGPWRRQPGGGPLLINMVHEIGNLRALCGEIVAVQAFASSATRNFPVEDTVSISLRFANGVIGSFMLSDTVAAPRSWEQTTREDPVFAAYPDEDCYIVAGTDGSLAIPTMLLRFYGDPGQRSWHVPFESEILAINHADPLARQLDNFCAVIRGTEEPGVSARDGLQNVRVLEAIRRAAASGQTCVVGN
jgi:predicted dehydrogenase